MCCGLWAAHGLTKTGTLPSIQQKQERLLNTCMNKKNLWILQTLHGESSKAFLDGKAAVCETWPTLGIIQNADDPAKSKIAGKWALGIIPREKTGITLLSAWDVAIPASSQNKELAWEWIKMYTSAERQQFFYDTYKIFSPRKAFWEQPAIKDSALYPLRKALDTANMWWRVSASVEVDTLLNTVVSAYLSDQIDLEKAVAQMDSGIKTALKNSPPGDGIKNYNR